MVAGPRGWSSAVPSCSRAADRTHHRGDVAGARSAYAAFDTTWGEIEDAIRAADRATYRAIEDRMRDVKVALGAVKAFQDAWPAMEGAVHAKSPAAYTATENDMAEAQALLASQPPKPAQADTVLVRMRDRLAPLAEAGVSHGCGPNGCWSTMLKSTRCRQSKTRGTGLAWPSTRRPTRAHP